MKRGKYIPGDLVNDIELIERLDRIGRTYYCKFRCPRCDTIFTARMSNVLSGTTTSCGCLGHPNYKRERNIPEKTDTEEYSVYVAWIAARSRCTNPNNASYKNYNPRGVVMCDAWMNNYKAFRSHMGLKPGPEYTLERVNNEGNYEPGNCVWDTYTAQNNNSRNNKNYTIRYPSTEKSVSVENKKTQIENT